MRHFHGQIHLWNSLFCSNQTIFPLHPSLTPCCFLQPFFLTPPPLISTYSWSVRFPQLVHISAPILHIPPPPAFLCTPSLPSNPLLPAPPPLPHADLWPLCLTTGIFSEQSGIGWLSLTHLTSPTSFIPMCPAPLLFFFSSLPRSPISPFFHAISSKLSVLDSNFPRTASLPQPPF